MAAVHSTGRREGRVRALISLPVARGFGTASATKALALMMLVAACGSAAPIREDVLARMRGRGTLRWGGDLQGGEPYVFQDRRDPDRLVGFEVEIAEALARRLGLRAEFVQNDWTTLLPSLERGDFDVAMNGIEVTPARRARVAFSRPYRSEEHTSELQSLRHLVCRLLLEKKKKKQR